MTIQQINKRDRPMAITYPERSSAYANTARDVRPLTAAQLRVLDAVAIILGALIVLAPLAMGVWNVPRLPLI
jgi:hypothetical protein